MMILADTILQLNRGGYIRWHAMTVDDGGLGLAEFSALFSKESRASYRRANNATKDTLLSAGNVQTVVHRSLAQLNTFKAAYTEARV